jgi:hypothetical protein
LKEKKYLLDYYDSEIAAGKVLVGIGLFIIALAFLISYTIKGELAYGIIFCLLPFGVFQTLSGGVIWFRKTIRRKKMLKQLHREIGINPSEERQHIEAIVKRIKIIRKIQEAIMLMAFITIFLGMAEVVEPAIMGFAMAALLMAAIMTAFDLFALRRAEEYVRRLNRKD